MATAEINTPSGARRSRIVNVIIVAILTVAVLFYLMPVYVMVVTG